MERLILFLPDSLRPLFFGLLFWQAVFVMKTWLWLVFDRGGPPRYYAYETVRFLLGQVILFWLFWYLLGGWVRPLHAGLAVLAGFVGSWQVWIAVNPVSELNMNGLFACFARHSVSYRRIPRTGFHGKAIALLRDRLLLERKQAAMLWNFIQINLLLIPLIVVLLLVLSR